MPPMIYLVDDEEVIRDACGWLFKSCGLSLQVYASAAEFLAWVESGQWDAAQPGCLILDVRMPVMTGVELFEVLVKQGVVPALPVIFLTGHGDVPMAVDMLKKGAFDFFEKPFNNNTLVERARQALEFAQVQSSVQQGQARIQMLLHRLSPREREVMEQIVAGKMNKVIADELGVSMRTVEVHRARIFAKMNVKSAVELTRVLNRAIAE